MALPLQNFTFFIASYFGIVVISLFIVKSVYIGIDFFKKGLEHGY